MKSINYYFYLCVFLVAVSSFRLRSTSKIVELSSVFNLPCFFFSHCG